MAKDRLLQIAKCLGKNEAESYLVPVTKLLSWIDAKQLNASAVNGIKSLLEDYGLDTREDLATLDKGSTVAIFNAVENSETKLARENTHISEYAIGALPSANTALIKVNPQHTLAQAITLMMANQLSQLPVMQGKSAKGVKGMISWKTIGSKLAFGKSGELASDYLEPAKIVLFSDSIFKVIGDVGEHDCVLVQNKKGTIQGIVTGYDLSEQFGLMSKPFMYLGEIERCIRYIFDSTFNSKEMTLFKNEADNHRTVKCAADLTFGEYLRAFQNPANWEKLNLPLDRVDFCARLLEILNIRNGVMHFKPDGIGPKRMHSLESFVEFLREIVRCKSFRSKPSQ